MKMRRQKVNDVNKEKKELKKVINNIIDNFEINTAVEIINNACHAFYLIYKESEEDRKNNLLETNKKEINNAKEQQNQC